jgi:hypothetical protein
MLREPCPSILTMGRSGGAAATPRPRCDAPVRLTPPTNPLPNAPCCVLPGRSSLCETTEPTQSAIRRPASFSCSINLPAIPPATRPCVFSAAPWTACYLHHIDSLEISAPLAVERDWRGDSSAAFSVECSMEGRASKYGPLQQPPSPCGQRRSTAIPPPLPILSCAPARAAHVVQGRELSDLLACCRCSLLLDCATLTLCSMMWLVVGAVVCAICGAGACALCAVRLSCFGAAVFCWLVWLGAGGGAGAHAVACVVRVCVSLCFCIVLMCCLCIYFCGCGRGRTRARRVVVSGEASASGRRNPAR